MSKVVDNKSDQIKSWLNSIDTDNLVSEEQESCLSVIESSILESSSSSESGEELKLGENACDTHFNKYENMIPQIPTLTFNNINISNSTNVYLGHIFRVTGNLNINVTHSETIEDDKLSSKDTSQQETFRPACLIFPRFRWLAMDPLSEPRKISVQPVEIVVICHTATTSSTLQARNIGIIRDFQTLNVEAQGFNDIVYNFLIGCDGIVYEGRGWNVAGDHTSGYNHKSIGIAFVGNFKHDLPTQRALKSCQKLFIRGVAEGHLSKDYRILTACQCSPNVNFDALYVEFKKWDHFCDITQ